MRHDIDASGRPSFIRVTLGDRLRKGQPSTTEKVKSCELTV